MRNYQVRRKRAECTHCTLHKCRRANQPNGSLAHARRRSRPAKCGVKWRSEATLEARLRTPFSQRLRQAVAHADAARLTYLPRLRWTRSRSSPARCNQPYFGIWMLRRVLLCLGCNEVPTRIAWRSRRAGGHKSDPPSGAGARTLVDNSRRKSRIHSARCLYQVQPSSDSVAPCRSSKFRSLPTHS
jgi:hypothetical protein